jgi:hypothetical protein
MTDFYSLNSNLRQLIWNLADLEVPDCFDYLSILEHKNPLKPIQYYNLADDMSVKLNCKPYSDNLWTHLNNFDGFCRSENIEGACLIWDRFSLLNQDDIEWFIRKNLTRLLESEIQLISMSDSSDFSRASDTIMTAIIASDCPVAEKFVEKYIKPTKLLPAAFCKYLVSYFNAKVRLRLKHNYYLR